MHELRVITVIGSSGAPGMSAVLRSLAGLGFNRHGIELLHARHGFAGLVSLVEQVASGRATVTGLLDAIAANVGLTGLQNAKLELVRLNHGSVLGQGVWGAVPFAATRCPEFFAPAVRHRVINLLQDLGVDAVIVCGGDGSLAAAHCLMAESGLKIVGIPATIDNELPVTETALGVDSALNALISLVGRADDAAGGHPEVMVFEVMGRTSGALARLAALVLGATVVLTPEQGALTNERILNIGQTLEQTMLRGLRRPIVLVAEGVGLDASLAASGDSHPTVRLAQELETYFRHHGTLTPIPDVSPSLAGHLLRAAAPSAADRVLAAKFAEAAWDVITSADEPSGVLGLRQGMIELHDFDAPSDPERIEAALALDSLQRDVITV